MEWYSGPGLVAWLETQGIRPTRDQVGKRAADSIKHWREGRRVTLWSVDRILIQLGLHVGMVPDDVVVGKPKNRVNGQGQIKRADDQRLKDGQLPTRKDLPVPAATIFRAFEREVPEQVLMREYEVSRKLIRQYKEEWENGSNSDSAGSSGSGRMVPGGAQATQARA